MGKVRKFAKIQPTIWKSQKFRSASPAAKLLGMYMLTAPYYCMVGIYELPRFFMQKDTGLSLGDLDSALSELIELDFCKYDDDTEVVWVVDMALSQIADRNLSPNQMTGVINELSRLYLDCEYPFVNEFLEKYKTAYPQLPGIADLYWDTNA